MRRHPSSTALGGRPLERQFEGAQCQLGEAVLELGAFAMYVPGFLDELETSDQGISQHAAAFGFGVHLLVQSQVRGWGSVYMLGKFMCLVF